MLRQRCLAGVLLAVLLSAASAAHAASAAKIHVRALLPGGPRLLAECPDLAAAQGRIRTLKREGKLTAPVEVLIEDGVYPLAAPLHFTPEDSGSPQAPITYRAAHPGRVTLSGGVQITGWRTPGASGRAGIWTATVPGVREGKLHFRQLFVNGRRAVPARSPNRGFHYTIGLMRRPE